MKKETKTIDPVIGKKPDNLIISDINWKYTNRSVEKGKNILVLGESGCGKTLLGMSAAKANKRPFFTFPCGSMSDPRASLIGNTQFDKEKGTFFSEAYFIKAIRTPNAVILLDELTRCHPDGWNILMSAIDPNQRYVRLDEKSDSETVKVAEGVCFIATANVGNEYTATRVLDRALLDRFSVIIEMASLNKEEELQLLVSKYPEVDVLNLRALTEVTTHTREECRIDNGKVDNYISTRAAVEIAELFSDGFTFEEIAEVAIYPLFSSDGGADSQRTYIKQYTQRYIPVKATQVDPNAPKKPRNTNLPWE